MGAEYHVKKGDRVRFWHDSWIGGVPLKIQFRYIFDICQKPNAMVGDFWGNGNWNIPVRRCLTGESLDEWQDLLATIDQVNIENAGEDDVRWVIDKSQTYSTKSLYYCLTHGGVQDSLNDLLWKSKMPLKVKIFLWQVFHNKLQTALNLCKREWHGSPLCCVCHKPETVNHILFECLFAQYIWCCVRDAFSLGGFPVSVQDLISEWMPGRLKIPKRLCFIFFAGLAWSLWKNRNKMAIEKCFPTNPDVVIHSTINLMQMWIDLQKTKDKDKLMELVQCLTCSMGEKKQGPISCSDIEAI